MDEATERARAPKVRQMLPADGWHAVMATMEGEVETTPLIGWALVEQEGDCEFGEMIPWSSQAVVGVYLDGGRHPEVVSGFDFFLGYVRSEEQASLFAEEAMKYAKNMQKAGR